MRIIDKKYYIELLVQKLKIYISLNEIGINFINIISSIKRIEDENTVGTIA